MFLLHPFTHTYLFFQSILRHGVPCSFSYISPCDHLFILPALVRPLLHTPPLIIFLYFLFLAHPHPFTCLSFPSSILLYPPVRYSSSCHIALKLFTAANIKIAYSLSGHGAEQSHRSRLTFQRYVIKKIK